MLAVLSDVHANLPALEAVLRDADERGCTQFISLGDVVGYGAQPAECIELLRERGVVNVLGNHDSYITLNQDCPRSRVVTEIIDYHRTLLDPSHVAWLSASHDSVVEGDVMFVHGGPEDHLDQYLYEISRETVPDGIRWFFSGHTHVQVKATFGDAGYCNPGSVGQPRDGDNRAAYAIFDGDEPVLHRVSYDIDRAVEAMKAAGFEPFCYENLYLGAQIGGRIDRVTLVESGESPANRTHPSR